MKRVKLTIAYDGTNYCGWQLQKNGITIEAVLNKALSELLREPIAVIGASRTDSGVHAMGNVAVFDTENRMPADKVCFALNQRLPEDIRIQDSCEVALNFHPRKHNCIKTYEYKILNRKMDMPVKRLYTHFCYVPLDEGLMRRAAAYLVGEHDFKSFCTVRTQTEETVRTIYTLDVEKYEDIITIRISGSGFLYNMVRIIAGTLMKVGTKVYPPEHVREILNARDRHMAGPTAIAKGLTLVGLEYEKKLPPEVAVENENWRYRMVQREIEPKKKAYLIIDHCRERDWDRFLMRNIHQAVRNGAEQVFICSRQGDGEIEEKDYGFYPVRYAYDIVRMEMEIPCLMEPIMKEIRMVGIKTEEFREFQEMYEEIFFDIPNSSADMDVDEKRKDTSYLLWWLVKDGRKLGFTGIRTGDKELELDLLGIIPSFQGTGNGRLALEAVLRYALDHGFKRMISYVATINEKVCRLYGEIGFREKERASRWFVAKNSFLSVPELIRGEKIGRAGAADKKTAETVTK